MSLSTLSHPTAAAAASGKSLFPAAPAAQSVRFPKARAPVPAAVSAATAAVHADSAEDRVSSLSQVSGVLGSQWGDEGKGKLVDVLAPRFDIVARCQVRGLYCANPCLEESSGQSLVVHEANRWNLVLFLWIRLDDDCGKSDLCLDFTLLITIIYTKYAKESKAPAL
jgi:adenylosuccinate synthase